MTYTVRPARVGDAPLLPAIERSAAQAFASLQAWSWIATDAVLSHADHLAFIDAGLDWVLVDEQDTPLGFLCATACDQALHIEELAIAHDYQGKGLGRQLVETVRDWAALEGFKVLTLTTFVEVPWNAPFYRKLGFEQLDGASLDDRLRRLLSNEASHGLTGRCAMRQLLA